MADPQYEHLVDAVRQGRPALTVELGKLYLQRHPDDPWALLYYADALHEIGRFADAHTAAERATMLLEGDPQVHAYRLLGHISDATGASSSAEAWFRRAIDVRPLDASAYIYLGSLQERTGRFAEAEDTYLRATGCTAGCIDEAYLNLGLLRRSQSDYVGALEALRMALTLRPEYPAAQRALEDVEAVLFEFPTYSADQGIP